jgi:hypothetical protein
MKMGYQGSIIVESEKNKGTTFIVKLPKDARPSIEPQVLNQVKQPNQVEQAPQIPKSETHRERH